ncbi:unnamed protein product [Durusdinium trenchii]|uniref:Uncharacterized protein n=3 Tax=Durusdinium trenchii TaxID=1381693 RepID=A0ABP0PGX1_9DINO
MQGSSLMNRAATQVSHFGPAARQVRWRQWLFPQTSKGWQPERFEHEGKALQFARQSKRIPIWKLGWATTIPTKYLIMVEHGQARLGPAYREVPPRCLPGFQVPPRAF